MKQITVFLSSQNRNKELAAEIVTSLEVNNLTVNLIDLVELDFPLYSSKTQDHIGTPNELKNLYAQCKASDGFIFVAPEYNGGIPPVLTNTLAWLSIIGKDWRDAFNRKVAGIATFSGGEGMNLIIGLRTQLAYVGLTVIGRTLQVNYKKPLNPESLADFTTQITSRV